MNPMERGNSLPAARIAGEVSARLKDSRCLVVTAPPGAGKSTLLPLTILEGLETPGKVLMLEPRRLAARQIAARMAWLAGEDVGQTVGYRIRFEKKISSSTRIEVLTEGILTRMMVDDPTLDGVSVVIFDEFHERSLTSDVALALVREAQKLVRPDLRIVIMSATIDAQAICSALDAPLVTSEGRMFPVECVNLDEPMLPELVPAMVRAVAKAHAENEGDILAFLPGEAEIRRCQEALECRLGETKVLPLYGMLPFDEQREAIAPSPAGSRKVVLATPIAETSLTIEGVRTVVDSGLCRKMVFDSQSGFSHMETVRISRDMADQRAGRAGRIAPGKCYRLWSIATDARMPLTRTPEILDSDLAPMVLDIAAWGGRPEDLDWLTAPPAAMVTSSRQLLRMLGALDEKDEMTAHGRRLAGFPCHPRVAQMLLRARNSREKALACDVAAVMEEKDPLATQAGADLWSRIDMLRSDRSAGRGSRKWSRMERISAQYRAMVRTEADNDSPDAYMIGALTAAAFPERVAKAHGDGRGLFLLASGELASVDQDDMIASCDWIAVASLSVKKDGVGRIFLASPLDPEDLDGMLRERDRVVWDSRKGAVTAQHERGIGCLVVSSRPIHGEVRGKIVEAICSAARKEGTSMLDFSDEVQNLQRRVACAASWHPELELPDLSTYSVLDRAGEWLPGFIGNANSVAELKKIDLAAALWSLLDYSQQQAVERIAPSHIAVPTGSRIRVEYRQGADAPVLRVRLQECFGLTDTPRVDDGRKAVLMELLSPGFKPVQLTQDLRSFWQGTYFEVRKELRRRYPKHSWPDNPLEAEAVRGVRKG